MASFSEELAAAISGRFPDDQLHVRDNATFFDGYAERMWASLRTCSACRGDLPDAVKQAALLRAVSDVMKTPAPVQAIDALIRPYLWHR